MSSFRKRISVYLVGALVIGCATLLNNMAWSELPKLSDPLAVKPKAGSDFQDLLQLMKQLNVEQTSRASQQSFERFFNLKSRGDEPVRMLEKVTSFKQTSAAAAPHLRNGKALPPRSGYRSF